MFLVSTVWYQENFEFFPDFVGLLHKVLVEPGLEVILRSYTSTNSCLRLRYRLKVGIIHIIHHNISDDQCFFFDVTV